MLRYLHADDSRCTSPVTKASGDLRCIDHGRAVTWEGGPTIVELPPVVVEPPGAHCRTCTCFYR